MWKLKPRDPAEGPTQRHCGTEWEQSDVNQRRRRARKDRIIIHKVSEEVRDASTRVGLQKGWLLFHLIGIGTNLFHFLLY